ncbi:SET domain-containing protein [Aspergillus cavernicola]|uniref:SET domain-containing protein n=1 Tax=Aspergillus cavernicola TaxID=176166 RepID=A0ABR4HZQ9_9EURO
MAQGNIYVVREIPGRGQAVVATSKILKGTRILAEHPLVTVPRQSTSLEAIDRLVNEQLERLDNDQRQSFFNLCNAHPGRYSETIGIVKTNALPFGSSAAEGGIFLQSSRINHSCSHNAQNTWNENTKKLTIHVFKDLEEGEEITIAYLNDSQNRASRQKALKEAFNFVCSCELCSLPSTLRQESDQRLSKISLLDDSIGDFDRILGSPKACLHDAHMLRQLLQQESIVDARVPRLYYDAFQIAIANGDQARARVFAEKAYAMRIILEGDDSPTTIRLSNLIRDPSTHSLYGMSMRWESNMNAVPRTLPEQEFEEWLWQKSATRSETGVANLRDQTYFPAFEGLPDENNIDLDYYDSGDGFRYTPRKHWCFLAEVVEVSYLFRRTLLVRDMAGQEVLVHFYTDGRGMEPSISCVQPGNTIAILYPDRHAFLDLSTGIRQEEINTIRVNSTHQVYVRSAEVN